MLFEKYNIWDGARASAGEGMAAPPALHGQGRDISFSKRDIPPFDPPRENCIAGLRLEGVRRLGNGSALRGGIASLAAIGGARRFGVLLLPAAALLIL